jgi:hypothetical protein
MLCLIPTEMLSPRWRRSTMVPLKLFADYLSANRLFSWDHLPLSSQPGTLSSLNIPAGSTSGANNALSCPADSPSTSSSQLNPFHWRLSAFFSRETLVLYHLMSSAIISHWTMQMRLWHHFLVCLGTGPTRALSCPPSRSRMRACEIWAVRADGERPRRL